MAPAKTHIGINTQTKIVDNILFNKDYLSWVEWGPVPDFAAPWRLLEIAFLIEKHIFIFQSSWPGFEPGAS